MRQNCVPEAEEFRFYAFVVGSPSEYRLFAEKLSLVPRALSSRLREKDAHFMMIETVLCDMDRVERTIISAQNISDEV